MRHRQLREFQGRTPAREVVVLDQGDDVLPFDRIRCPDLIAIGQAWLDMPRNEGRTIPEWRAFSPAAFASCLDKLCVLKARDWRAHDIEFSLYGNHPTDFLGNGRSLVMKEMRGDPMHEANYLDILNRAGRAIENAMPQYVRKTLSWNEGNYIDYETLMLPFVAEDGVQRLLQPVSARARVRVTTPSPGRWCEVRG